MEQEAPSTDILSSKYIGHKASSASLDETNAVFILKLYKDSNAVVSKTQIYSSLHNTTCFKYGVAVRGKCWFDFSHSYINKIKVTELSSIKISKTIH